jgi:hypothetical protein
MITGLIQIVIVFALAIGGWWLVLKLRKRQNKLAKFSGMIGVGAAVHHLHALHRPG